MEKNIYDLIISELIIAGNANNGNTGGSSGTPKVTLSNNLNIIDINAPATPVVIYKSEISNIPSGYTIFSHTITYPGGVTGNSTSPLVVTGNITLSIPTVGSIATATSNVILRKAGEVDIILTSVNTITGVTPLYYGILPFANPPVTAGLIAQSSTKFDFYLTSSAVGRLYIALPVSITPTIKSVTDPNGLLIPIESFTVITNAGYKYYILNWDTQLTGSNQKKFIINFN